MPQTTIAEAALSPEERTPHNAPDATGSFKGLRRDHTLPDMVQAIMEGVDFAFADSRQIYFRCTCERCVYHDICTTLQILENRAVDVVRKSGASYKTVC